MGGPFFKGALGSIVGLFFAGGDQFQCFGNWGGGGKGEIGCWPVFENYGFGRILHLGCVGRQKEGEEESKWLKNRTLGISVFLFLFYPRFCLITLLSKIPSGEGLLWVLKERFFFFLGFWSCRAKSLNNNK